MLSSWLNSLYYNILEPRLRWGSSSPAWRNGFQGLGRVGVACGDDSLRKHCGEHSAGSCNPPFTFPETRGKGKEGWGSSSQVPPHMCHVTHTPGTWLSS